MNEDVLELLNNQDWDDIMLRLTAYARSLLKVRSWRGQAGGLVPGGREAADFAMEAICQVYRGERKWKPQQDPDLLDYLCSVVRSRVGNALRGAENQTGIRPEDEEVAERLLETAGATSDDDFMLGFLDYLRDEPDLYRVVECFFDGCRKPAEVRERLGLTPAEYTNRRKRLCRQLDAHRKDKR